MRSKSYLFLLLVLGLGLISGYLYSQSKYNYGLDVRGGIRLTYQMELAESQKQSTTELRSRLLDILGARAQGTLGVAEPVLQPKGLDQIVVELPGATNIEDARSVIGTSAKIQFYHARTVRATRYPSRPYDVANANTESEPSVTLRRTLGNDTKEIKFGDPEYAQIIRNWPLILEGEDLAAASYEPAGAGYRPSMTFSASGSQKMERWSRANPEENIATVLDGKILSINSVQPNTILSTGATIQGSYPAAYVKRLIDLLNAGALPVNLKELSHEKVDPTIGAQALDKMVFAGLISFGLTAIFLLAYYAFPGFVALIALALYVLFTLTVLKLIGATFSLAAIAGFILSIGMAVDANILVFERFKEEMKRGKSLETSIDLGFRRAFSAIFDSNACTVLTSMVLAYFGTQMVKGFATTLIIGVIISLFTALTVTRSLLMFLVSSGIGSNPKWYAVERNWFFSKIEARAETNPMPVIEKWKRYFIISGVSIVVLLPFIWPLNGLKPNVEFLGGREISFANAQKNLSPSAIVSGLERAGIKGANVKSGGEGAQRVAIVTVPPTGPLQNLSDAQATQRIAAAAGYTVAEVKGSSAVGPTIRSETISNAILGVVISSVLIVVWLAFRFGVALGGFVPGLRFGLSAIGALVHDVLFVIGVSAFVGWLLGWEISALFISSMLTVIGFSVHDTIVIFDRIRENLRRPAAGEDIGRIMNRSISQSFARSVNTSMTVIGTLIIMLIAGTSTPDLKLFCATMLAGILSGTYSSIFNASPILYLWDKAVAKKQGEAETLVGRARAEADKHRLIAPVAVPVTVGKDTPPTRSYGQVKRRASAVSRSQQEIDDEP